MKLSKGIICLGVGLLFIGMNVSSVSAQPPCIPREVPAFLFDALEGSTSDFFRGLQEARVSTGVILKKRDYRPLGWHVGKWSKPWKDERDPVPLENVLDRFRAIYSEYTVGFHTGQLRIAPTGGVEPLKLRQPVERFELVEQFLDAAIAKVEQLTDPRVTVPTMAFPNPSTFEVDKPLPPELPDLSLVLEDVTVVDVLQEVSCRIPGTVWIAILEKDGSLYGLAFVYPYGIVREPYEERRKWK